MKIENQKISDCRVKLIVNATAEETREDYDKIVKAYKARASIPGFRPGKAPLNVIEKFYGNEMTADIRATLVARFSGQAVEHEKLSVVARVNVEDVVFAPATGISFIATYDIKPEFKLPKYQKLNIKFNEVKVDDAEVEKQVAQLRASMSPREDVEDAVAADDMLQIDFSAKSGRKTLLEAVPGSERFASGENFWALASDEASFIPGLAAAVIGKKKGETFEFETKFPKEFHFEALRGVKAKYTGTVKAVRRTKLLADEEVAKNVGMESMEKLRETIRKHLLDDATAAEERRNRDDIAEILLKKADFAIPETMVEIHFETKLDQILRSEVTGKPNAEEYAKEHAEEFKKQARTAAERQVRLTYILAGIAAEQKIEVAESEIQQEVAAAANYYISRGDKTMTAAKLRENLEESGRIVLLRDELLNGKVLNWIAKDTKEADGK